MKQLKLLALAVIAVCLISCWGKKKSKEIRRTDTDYAFDLKGVMPYGYSGQGITGYAGFGIEIRDIDGNVIHKVGATASGIGGMYSYEDMKEALRLKAGETATIRWQEDLSGDTTSSTAKNAEWESALDEYEKYVDQYIELYKKAMAGDISALASYANLLESAENFAEKLEDAEDEMTVEQLNRYMDITQKLTTIAY